MGNFEVYLGDAKTHVGKCYWTHKNRKTSTVFNYDPAYFALPNCYAIDPAMSLVSGAFAFQNKLPNALQDAAPDRWGRNLITKRLRKLFESEDRPPNLSAEPSEIDYLLGVSDFSRQGALRFKTKENSEFQFPGDIAPKLIELPKLLHSARKLETGQDFEAVKYLLDAGTASLGGARPKASVRDGNDLYIAKFEHGSDEYPVIAFEWVALQIAKNAGVNVPENRLIEVSDSKVLLTKRFDRAEEERIGYISVMTLLQADDGDSADYLAIAEEMIDLVNEVDRDLEELFRRIALTIVINNTDDHLRNHGFIREGKGWRLSPIFDINPNPNIYANRVTSFAGETNREKSFGALIAKARNFGLTEKQAQTIITEVQGSAKAWRNFAKQAGIKPGESKQFEKVFENES